MKAAKSTHIDGGLGVGIGKQSAGVTRASIDAGVDNQGVVIQSDKDVNIKSGGKTVMQGTQIDAKGSADIQAKGGIDKQSTTSAGGNLGMDHAGGDYNRQDVDIKQGQKKEGGKEKEKSLSDDEEAMKAIVAKMKEKSDGKTAPASTAQSTIMKEMEMVMSDKTLTAPQKEKQIEVLKAKLENQKTLDQVKQDKEMDKHIKEDLLNKLETRMQDIEKMMKDMTVMGGARTP